jgi:MFS family permease
LSRIGALTLVAIAELLAMGLWFAVSAVSPAIAAEWRLTEAQTSWFTLAVQVGFVAGTILSAVFNLPDVMRVRQLFALSALLGAVANAWLAWGVDSFAPAVVLRFLTGIFLAGVYPPGMKIIATWFRTGRGFALGVLVGALTLGKASPYLLNAVGFAEWRSNVVVASLLAIAGGAIVLWLVHDGPHAMPRQPFDPSQIVKVFSSSGVRLANYGYFGHMWELYAMWTWAPVMIRASVAAAGDSPRLAEIVSFAVIGAGGVGCVAAGLLADRVGRPVIAGAAMAISGACCLVVGLLFGASSTLLAVVAVIWGAAVVADSAQFSACVADFADQRYLGTALTVQTAIGFLLTTISIRMMPPLVARFGWEWAFAFLAPGPLLGIVAMERLRHLDPGRGAAKP